MAYEDFTTYTEVDPGNDITLTSSATSWDDLVKGSESYVYKDYGVDHFSGDFTHSFEMVHVNPTGSVLPVFWLLSNYLDDWKGLRDAGRDDMSLSWFGGILRLGICNGGNFRHDDSVLLSEGTPYFITITRDDDGGVNGTGRLTAYIRTGSHAGTLVDTLQIDALAGEQNDYRYLYSLNTYKDTLTVTSDGYVADLDIGEGEPPGGETTAVTVNPFVMVDSILAIPQFQLSIPVFEETSSFDTPTIFVGINVIATAFTLTDTLIAPAFVLGNDFDFTFDLRAFSERLEDLALYLRMTKTRLIDLLFDLRATDGTSLQDLLLDLRVTDATVFQNMDLDLRTVKLAPGFSTYISHRISSILKDTGL